MTNMTQEHYIVPPWLSRAVAPDAVRNGLMQQIPEFASGKLTIIDCQVNRLRLKNDQGRWSGICKLTIADTANKEPETVSLLIALIPPGLPEPMAETKNHSFGTEHWHCYLPELRLELSTQLQDARLGALSELTDPDAACQLLEESIRVSGNLAYRNLRIQSCRPQVMRYKPGSRCTVLYHLNYSSSLAEENSWPATVVAKTYHGGKGEIAHEGMVALWQSPMRSSPTVTIAEPLAYMPESRVLVQGPIREEMTLKQLVSQTLLTSDDQCNPGQIDVLHGYIRKTAVGLAELHQCGVRCGEVVTWEDELSDLIKRRASLTPMLPQLTNFADPLLERLQQLAKTQPADVLAPAHRSFRPAQVLLHKGEIGFIDFDGFCQAEPAMDLALFMTTIKSMVRKAKTHDSDENGPETSISQAQLDSLELAEELCAVFLTEYEEHVTVSRIRIAIWETLFLISLVLGSWKKLKLERLGYCRHMLEQHIKRHGFDS